MFCFVLSYDLVSCCYPGFPWTCHVVAKDNLEALLLLPWFPVCMWSSSVCWITAKYTRGFKFDPQHSINQVSIHTQELKAGASEFQRHDKFTESWVTWDHITRQDIQLGFFVFLKIHFYYFNLCMCVLERS